MDIETGPVPSQLLVHGQRALPLGVDNSFNCFLAAARFGRGRVVLAGHESLILNQTMLPFVLNALRWLMGNQTGRIGLASEMKALKSVLPNSSFEWSETELLTNDLSVFCSCSLGKTDPKKVEEFVAEGGGLLIGAEAWMWGRRNPDSNCMTQYPNNIILKRFGLGIISQVVQRGRFPVPNPEVINYHIRRALSQYESVIHSQGSSLQEGWLNKLSQDCFYMFQMTHQRISIYDSVKEHALKMIQSQGFPSVTEQHPITKGSSQAFLLSLAYELFKSGVDRSQLLPPPTLLSPTESPMTIKISTGKKWRASGSWAHKEREPASFSITSGCPTSPPLQSPSSFFSIIFSEVKSRKTGSWGTLRTSGRSCSSRIGGAWGVLEESGIVDGKTTTFLMTLIRQRQLLGKHRTLLT